jgi:hypothetical protein
MSEEWTRSVAREGWRYIWAYPFFLAAMAPFGLLAIAWRAFVFWKIWSWYLAAYLVPLPYLTAMGAILALDVIRYRSPQRPSTAAEAQVQLLNSLLYPPSVLLSAWILKVCAPYLEPWITRYSP